MFQRGGEARALIRIVAQPVEQFGEAPLAGVDAAAPVDGFQMGGVRGGALWLATPAGLSVVRGKQFQNVVAGGPLLIDFIVTLSEGRDGAVWAGTYGKGL